jgi:glycosyltransferase involved in cell wall biosynthesis
MHVGIDSHSAEREGEGNSTYCRGLVSALAALGGKDEFTLFAASPVHAFYRSLAGPARPRVVRVPQGAGLVRLGAALGLAAARARVDCLHVQYFAPFCHRRPLVVTVHDLGYLHVPDAFPPALRMALRLLVPPSLARAARIITDSEFSRQDLAKRYDLGPDRIAVIPLGARESLGPLAPDAAAPVLARYNLRPGYLFTLGRLNRRKNLDRLIRACALVREGGAADARLVIGGKPDFGVRPVLEGLRHAGDEGAVRWIGLVPEEDLPALYSGAAAFVYPSLFEGFGLPILEAMACGTPVVSSDRAAMPELVGDAGFVVDPESIEAMAAAIARLLRDRALAAELGQRGLARSRQYSWEETARRTLAVYHEAAGR